MKKSIIIAVLSLTAAISTLAGCTRSETERGEEPQTAVTFVFSGDDFAQHESRAVDENALGNVTLRLFAGEELKYTFSTDGAELVRNIAPGSYTLYATANIETSSPQEYTRSELEALTFDYDPAALDAAGAIPMTRKMEVDILPGQFNRIEVELERMVSKIDLNISISEELAGSTILSVQLKSMAGDIGMFGTAASGKYFDGGIEKLPSGAKEYSRAVYVPENCRGTNPAITGQDQKGRDNAPENATYLHITVRSSVNKMVDYFIFLGENNTTDFNVRRNHHYTYDIKILGENLTDTRISEYTLAYGTYVWNPWTVYGYGASPITVVAGYRSQEDYGMKVRIDFTCKSKEALTVDGVNVSYIETELTPDVNKSWEVFYNPEYFTNKNNRLDIRWTFTDKYGRLIGKTAYKVYANWILFRNPSYRDDDGRPYAMGVVEVANTVHTVTGISGNNGLISGYIGYLGESAKITLTDAEGCEFSEWWIGDNFNKVELVSDLPNFTYIKPTPNIVELTPYYDRLPATLTYHANGGTGGLTIDDLYWNEQTASTLAEASVTAPAGFTFAGWNKQADGGGASYAPGAKFKLRGDITLYAQWEPL